MHKRYTERQGFTIVELLIVVVVIAILATIAIVAYRGIQDRARASALKADLSQAAKQLAVDKALVDNFPASTASADGGKGLKASSGTAYQYTVNNSANPPTFCLSGINGTQAYHVTNGGVPQEGVCPGHSGPVAGGGSSITCDPGFIPVPGNAKFGTSNFCVAKYEAKNVGGKATSQAAGTPWTTISQTSAISAAVAACSGCHLITEAEWLTIAHDVLSVASNWSGGSVGSGYIYTGHSDGSPAADLAASSDSDGYSGTGNASGNQRRTLTLSNGEVIWDLAGNVWEWTAGQTTGGQPGASFYMWREWNTVEGTGSLIPNPFPSFGTPAASSWTSSNGIGRLSSNANETAARGFLRGGHWDYGAYGGVLALYLEYAPSSGSRDFGFRVAK